jgi:hypothetical protein
MSGKEGEQEKTQEGHLSQERRPNSWIEIPASVEVLHVSQFAEDASLVEIRFASDSYLKIIHGFRSCKSFSRIDIPASVKIISESAFSDCSSLTEVRFPLDSCLRDIQGFHSCTSLCQLDIPASVEIINGFNGCKSLREVMLLKGSRLKAIGGFQFCALRLLNIPRSVITIAFAGRAFLTYCEDSQLKQSRRRFHLHCAACQCFSRQCCFDS